MGSQLFRKLAIEADWRNELESWLCAFAAALRTKTRRQMCPAYSAGLIGPGDRKRVQPKAARGCEVSYHRSRIAAIAGPVLCGCVPTGQNAT